jgi:hypothetical protein
MQSYLLIRDIVGIMNLNEAGSWGTLTDMVCTHQYIWFVCWLLDILVVHFNMALRIKVWPPGALRGGVTSFLGLISLCHFT